MSDIPEDAMQQARELCEPLLYQRPCTGDDIENPGLLLWRRDHDRLCDSIASAIRDAEARGLERAAQFVDDLPAVKYEGGFKAGMSANAAADLALLVAGGELRALAAETRKGVMPNRPVQASAGGDNTQPPSLEAGASAEDEAAQIVRIATTYPPDKAATIIGMTLCDIRADGASAALRALEEPSEGLAAAAQRAWQAERYTPMRAALRAAAAHLRAQGGDR